MRLITIFGRTPDFQRKADHLPKSLSDVTYIYPILRKKVSETPIHKGRKILFKLLQEVVIFRITQRILDLHTFKMATNPSKIDNFFKNDVAKKGNEELDLVFDESIGELRVIPKKEVKSTDRKVHLKMNKFFYLWGTK